MKRKYIENGYILKWKSQSLKDKQSFMIFVLENLNNPWNKLISIFVIMLLISFVPYKKWVSLLLINFLCLMFGNFFIIRVYCFKRKILGILWIFIKIFLINKFSFKEKFVFKWDFLLCYRPLFEVTFYYIISSNKNIKRLIRKLSLCSV